jgi:predicted RNase H-like nuclease (RuvC/YqgF family)
MAIDLSPVLNAELTVLGYPPSAAAPVAVTALEGKILTLSGAPALAPGQLVKVREADRLWLGELIECHPGGLAVVQVVHSLRNVDQLSRLAARFYGKPQSTPASSGTAKVS